jgi:hypothetical protein
MRSSDADAKDRRIKLKAFPVINARVPDVAPNSYPAEIEVRLSVNRSQSLDHRAGLFPGWLDQGGPSAAVRPALALVGRAPRR